jgi:hypothetical protein
VRTRAAALSPRAKLALAAGAVLVYALVVWFVLIGPKRSEASSLSTQIAAAETQAHGGSGAAKASSHTAATPAADVLRLSKAMPSSGDQAGLVLELARLARAADVPLTSVEPAAPATDASGATLVPVTVTVSGTYGQVTRFLRSARQLVSFSRGRLDATGRLFSVKGVELAESSTGKFPLLDATIQLDAYAYDGPIPPPTPVAPPVQGTTTTSGATAAGATS